MTSRLRCAAALALGLAALLGCRRDGPERIALVGATVIDGNGGPVLSDAVVVVLGDRIEQVAARGSVELPRGTRTIDVSGKWIIPGLIDAHAHVAPWSLSRYLAYGVTAIRDVHGTLDSILALREGANLNAFPSPRIYTAGAMLDQPPTTYPDALPVETPEAARKAVDRLAVAGVDYIKAYTRMTPTLLGAAIDEARAFNLGVGAHLGLTDAVQAAELGIASIEHLSGVPEAAARNAAPFAAAHEAGFFRGWTFFERSWATLDSAALARVARQLAEHDVVLVPTLVLHETFSRLDDPAVLQDSSLRAVPDSEEARWNVPDMIARAGWTDADFVAFRRSRPMQDLFVREFRAAGGTIAAGTDAANQLLVPGFSAHTELELLVGAGLTPADALLAGTRNVARLVGADSIGVLAAGKVADLLVLGRDPLRDIRNTRAIEQVMLRGHLMPADSLRAGW